MRTVNELFLLHKIDRATRKELQAEIEARMRRLKFDERIISHRREGMVYYSMVDEAHALTPEMQELVYIFSDDRYAPYHAIYSESSMTGRTLYVLNVSLDKADWEAERASLANPLKLPCDIIYMDHRTHKRGETCLLFVADAAFCPSMRVPISVEESPALDWRDMWRAFKAMIRKKAACNHSETY